MTTVYVLSATRLLVILGVNTIPAPTKSPRFSTDVETGPSDPVTVT
jgi:hypothetical protein